MIELMMTTSEMLQELLIVAGQVCSVVALWLCTLPDTASQTHASIHADTLKA